MWSLTSLAVTNRLRGRSWLSQSACCLVSIPPFVRPMRRPLPPLPPFLRPCCSVSHQLGRIGHDRFLLVEIGSKTYHHTCVDTLVALTLPAIVERLLRTANKNEEWCFEMRRKKIRAGGLKSIDFRPMLCLTSAPVGQI